MKEKVTGILIVTILALVVGGMLYLAIKYPPKYPIYENMVYPPVYSPYPLIMKSSNCIKNPEWCY